MWELGTQELLGFVDVSPRQFMLAIKANDYEFSPSLLPILGLLFISIIFYIFTADWDNCCIECEIFMLYNPVGNARVIEIESDQFC